MGLENEANVEVRYTLLYLKPISGKIWGCKKTSGPLQDYRLDLSLWSFYYNDRTIDKKRKEKGSNNATTTNTVQEVSP